MAWRPIAGYPAYLVGDDGTVINVKRDRALKPYFDSEGYVRVTLCHANKAKHFSVHRLVATAFIRQPVEGEQVNHKNGDRADNRPINLEWVTQAENQRHSYEHLGRQYRKPQAPVQVKRGDEVLVFESQASLARTLGVHPVKIYNALCGRGRIGDLEVSRV